jgi:septal ring factor EnvC (AmiA/AmiB activator)
MRTAVLLGGTAAAAALGCVAVAATGERLARLNLEETQLSVSQAQNMNQLSRLLSVIELLRRDPPPALLVSPQDARDAVRAAILVKAMTPQLQERARTYASVAGEMMRQRRLAAIESETLFARESLAADAAPEPTDLALRGPAPAPLPDALLAPPQQLSFPVQGAVVRRFGDALAGGGKANGLTLSSAHGARVTSPGGGLVQYVGPVKGWGTILILRLAGGYHLVLAGLERTSVEVGQSVAPGQPVGWMPDGRQSSSELYLEVREQGAPVDPSRWLKNNAG